MATWLSDSEAANVDDRISSPMSRPTIESCPSLARLAQKIAVASTRTAVSRPKAAAQTAATTGAASSTENMISWGARPLKNDPITMDSRLPTDSPRASAPSAKSEVTEWPNSVPRCTLRSRKASRNRM